MKKKIILLLAFSPLMLCLQCKKCKEGKRRVNIDIANNVKATLFQFSSNTRWVFKSNTGDLDTAFLGAPLYSYDNGNCVGEDCCEMEYVESAHQKINFQVGTDGLDKFTEFYFPSHCVLALGNSFTFSTNQSFNNAYKTTVSINGTSLNDIEYRIALGPNKGDIYIDAVYWSLSKGLVRYDYQQLDGSFISYERQDF